MSFKRTYGKRRVHCSPYDTEDIDGMKEHLQANVTVLSLVNPFVCGASGGDTYFYRS